jgi:drug/metabolite transporter (DMT)-like permease
VFRRAIVEPMSSTTSRGHDAAGTSGVAPPATSARTAVGGATEGAAGSAVRWAGVVDWALLVLPGVIWGASFLFIAEGLQSIGPAGITFVRIAIGFGILALVPAARKPIPRSDWPAVALLGVIWLAFPLSMFPFAEQRVSSALTGMLNGTNPLFTALVASLLARQAPSRAVSIGLAVGFAGTLLVAWPTV